MTGFTGGTLTSLVLAAGMVTVGCSSEGTPPTFFSLAKVSGDEQSAVVGQPLANPLVVEVTQGATPSAGTTVTWSTTSPGGSVVPTSGPTGPDGVASTAWTLGTVSGTQRVTVSLSGGSLETFRATAVADAATTVIKGGGDEQIAEVGSQLALPVEARVTDQHGNGVQGVAVGWSATGATVSSPSVTSNASGVSSVNVTAGGTVGPIVITATAGGLSGSPLTFNATAVVTGTAPGTAGVAVSNNLFSSNRNLTTNPAVDTVAVNGTVTWTWVNTGITTHSVASEGAPSFPSSSELTGAGQTYSFTFPAAGTYQYTCAVHPGQMTGRIVVR
jgi:plastocyanin